MGRTPLTVIVAVLVGAAALAPVQINGDGFGWDIPTPGGAVAMARADSGGFGWDSAPLVSDPAS